MKLNQSHFSNWRRVFKVPTMPDDEFPDYANGRRDLDRRAGLLPVAWVLFGAAVVVGTAWLLLN
jgi:hypothetical protein